MVVRPATPSDYSSWIVLAREVEEFFGPMADEHSFQQGFREAISQKTAFCVALPDMAEDESLDGGIVIAPDTNEIVWLAVAKRCRGRGIGEALLVFALDRLDRRRDIHVQTFDPVVTAGTAARNLYRRLGFVDDRPAGLNPAGIPTVIMRLSAFIREGRRS
ncbi:GNAT family N-acetyltransferase [candidate division KSB1 bacterium]|nr:GNAT family N-acetyltransferase [candidate division KSB1 bacterium]